MTKGKYLILITLLFTLFSCEDDFDKYEKPEWLEGLLFTRMETIDNLQTFTKCVELSGYDKVIDVSGSYTVFAPSDEAFEQYFKSHPEYNSVEDIPQDELLELVKYHIVQNAWSRDQLRELDVNGWIDPKDEFNNKAWGYKRQTVLMRDDYRFGIVPDRGYDKWRLVDTTETSFNRRVINDTRKYVPIFYSEYFALHDLPLSDYSFYFDRQFENPDDIYFAGAKTGEEYFADNGFIHIVDKVVEPLKNGYELLKSDEEYDYTDFLSLIQQFPELKYDPDKTFDQAGAEQGLQVDSLFELTFPDLTFDITSERTKAPAGGVGLPTEVTIRFHHGLVGPINSAFQQFLDEYVRVDGGWGTLEFMPRRIKRIIANSYLSENAIYASDVQNGFLNGENDLVVLNQASIIDKQYGSNTTFIGVNEPIIPRAFGGVTGPVYQKRGYSRFMNIIEYTGLGSALKRQNSDYAFFVMNDQDLERDSVMFYSYIDNDAGVTETFYGYEVGRQPKRYDFGVDDLRVMLMNQLAVETPKGTAQKEFLQTLGGNHIIWDNSDNSVSGTSPSSTKYRGGNETDKITIYPEVISNNADNGTTYEVKGLFKYSSGVLYEKLKIAAPKFTEMLVDAGLAINQEARIKFISMIDLATVFAPTDSVLNAIQADTLKGDDLTQFLKIHFFLGDEVMFTDNKMVEGYYQSAYGNGKEETPISVYLKPGPDYIEVLANDGSVFLHVDEDPDKTNIITTKTLSSGTDFPNIATTGAIHVIDKAFDIKSIDYK